MLLKQVICEIQITLYVNCVGTILEAIQRGSSIVVGRVYEDHALVTCRQTRNQQTTAHMSSRTKLPDDFEPDVGLV